MRNENRQHKRRGVSNRVTRALTIPSINVVTKEFVESQETQTYYAENVLIFGSRTNNLINAVRTIQDVFYVAKKQDLLIDMNEYAQRFYKGKNIRDAVKLLYTGFDELWHSYCVYKGTNMRYHIIKTMPDAPCRELKLQLTDEFYSLCQEGRENKIIDIGILTNVNKYIYGRVANATNIAEVMLSLPKGGRIKLETLINSRLSIRLREGREQRRYKEYIQRPITRALVELYEKKDLIGLQFDILQIVNGIERVMTDLTKISEWNKTDFENLVIANVS